MPAHRRALPPKPPSRDVNAASRCCPPATVSSPRLPSSSPRPAAQRCAGLPSCRRKSREPRRPTRPPPAAGRGVVSRFSAPPVGLTRSPRFHVLHTVCHDLQPHETPLSAPRQNENFPERRCVAMSWHNVFLTPCIPGSERQQQLTIPHPLGFESRLPPSSSYVV